MDQQNVFVTGASRGIGKALALEFARAGYGVAFSYVSSQAQADETLRELEAIGAETKRPMKAYRLDVRDSAQVEEVCEGIIDEFETVSAVINNAGINKNNAAAWMSDEEWFDVLNTNLSGAFFVVRHFLPHFLSNKFGRFLHLSSLASDGTSGQINYAASKAGLLGLSRTIAKEYGRKGITSNVIIPGVFLTDMVKDSLSKSLEEFWLQFCPAARMGEMDELTKMAVFLASSHASFVNGEAIRITGGLTYAP